MRQFLFSLFIMTGLVLTTGCVEHPVAWLPDSSGFFTAVSNLDKHPSHARIMYYDVKEKSAKEIDKSKQMTNLSFEVSPNGKWLPIFEGNQGNNKITLSLLDVRTKKISKKVTTFDSDGAWFYTPVWSGDNKHLAVQERFFGQGGRSKKTPESVFLVEIATGKKRQFEGDSLVWVGTKPVDPSGNYFLVRDKKKQMYKMDWFGKRQKISTKRNAEVGNLPSGISTRPPIDSKPFESALSVWKKDKAIMRWQDKVWTIDLKKNEIRFSKVKPMKSPSGRDVLNMFRFADNGATIYVTHHDPKSKKKGSRRVLEIAKPGQAESKTYFQDEKFDNVWVQLFPSPDGNYLAVWVMYSGRTTTWACETWLVNRTGEIVKRIE